MTTASPVPFDPELDLVLERHIDVPPARVWAAWTQPEHLVHWFTPRPWETVSCEIDLRPGGVFHTVMRSPEGEIFDEGPGCYLEVLPERRLSWTSALLPGFRPPPEGRPLPLTAVLMLEPQGAGTKYTAFAIHRDPTGRSQHEAMGFHEGWGTVVDQLEAYAKASM